MLHGLAATLETRAKIILQDTEDDYIALDPIRPDIRGNDRVEPWYAQNMLLYVARSWYQQTPRLHAYAPVEDPGQLLPWVYGGTWRGRVRWRGPPADSGFVQVLNQGNWPQ